MYFQRTSEIFLIKREKNLLYERQIINQKTIAIINTILKTTNNLKIYTISEKSMHTQ